MRVLYTLGLGIGLLMTVGLTMSASAELTPLHLTPTEATPGATVTIIGEGFGPFQSTEVNKVTFHGHAALIQRWEPDLIEAKVPYQAQDGDVEIRVGHQTWKAGRFTVVRPTIQRVTPEEVEPGKAIQILGNHFGNTGGPRDPNSMFGVNDVLIGGVPVRATRWRNDKIEAIVPANAKAGEVVVRLGSADPLPDGSCCAPVRHTVSNAGNITIIPPVRVDPLRGPVGTKVVLFGKGFGQSKQPGDQVLIGGHPLPIAQWKDTVIVGHVPLEGQSGPIVLKAGGRERTVGEFTLHVPKATSLSPVQAPIGTLLKIKGEHFGSYSESGATPYSFTDFDKGDNSVEIGGVPAVIYRWHDDRIDVWVPFSAKSGPVVVKRGAGKAKPDGTCCAEKGIVSTEAGMLTVTIPTIESYAPATAGVDELVTIKGSGFGTYLKTAEATQPGLNEGGHDRAAYELGENISRTEVLFNGIAAVVVSWSDTEITARVPRRPVFGMGKKNQFFQNLGTGPLVVRRGAWDLLPDGSCCTPKKWLTVEAGSFTIQAKNLPDQGYYTDTRPGASTAQ